MISRFHISTTRLRQSLERMERSVLRTSSVTMPTASSSIAAGSTKAAQLRLARGRPESLSRPCVRLRPPVWRRLTKRRLSAARSNGRTHRTRAVVVAPTSYSVGSRDVAIAFARACTLGRAEKVRSQFLFLQQEVSRNFVGAYPKVFKAQMGLIRSPNKFSQLRFDTAPLG